MAKKKTNRGSGKLLTGPTSLTRLQDVKAIVQDRMKELGLSPYDVAKLVKGKVTPQTVYNFTKGERHMSTRNLPVLLAALDLEVRPKQ